MQIAITTTTVSAHPHPKPLVSLLRPSPPHRVRIHPFSHRLSTTASAMASSVLPPPQQQQLTITRPDDWHLHLRDGEVLAAVLPHSARHFQRAIVMPNLKPPVTTTARALEYREEILRALPPGSSFTPLMTLYLTDTTSPEEIKIARKSGVVFAVKLYPAGATTNSQDGVTDILGKCLPVLEEMVRQDMPLLVHGEVTDPHVDTFDREKVFIERILAPLVQKLPQLKIVMEHITTMDAVNFVESCKEGHVAATVTPQHLLLNRNALFQGGLQPHNYCLPVLKRETHRQAIVSAVTSGSRQYFLGTDSAPHDKRMKECSCGCAGIYSAPVALSLYAKVFEEGCFLWIWEDLLNRYANAVASQRTIRFEELLKEHEDRAAASATKIANMEEELGVAGRLIAAAESAAEQHEARCKAAESTVGVQKILIVILVFIIIARIAS